MLKRQEGFTLVELMVTMLIVVFVLAAASQVFTALLTQFKQQSKVAETSMEAVVGLELLRRDIENAGYGIPWAINGTVAYQEAAGANPGAFNDAPTASPRALIANNPAFTTVNDSDYLVIKSVSAARNDAARKWTTLSSTNAHRVWDPDKENLADTARVIVLTPGTTGTLTLVDSAGTFSVIANSPANSSTGGSTFGFRPPDVSETRVIYGIDTRTTITLRMPFNRTDYYISTTGVPGRCAPGTGVLVKAVLDNATGANGGDFDLDNDGTPDELPILDCVADLQTVFGLDNDGDGDFQNGVGAPPDGYTDDISTLDAQQVREQVKEVRVYILTHEGQVDRDFDHGSSTINVGETGLGGRTFDLAANIGSDWRNYRWKVYTMAEKPVNLR